MDELYSLFSKKHHQESHSETGNERFRGFGNRTGAGAGRRGCKLLLKNKEKY